MENVNNILFHTINDFAGINRMTDMIGIVVAQYMPLLFVVFLIYRWFFRHAQREHVAYAGYAAILGLFLNFVITTLYFHPRPFMNHVGTLLVQHVSETSFPSDHTTFMLSIAFMLLFFKETRTTGTVFFFLGVLGGIARIFCGLHYPLDIVGSLIVATIASSLIFLSRKKIHALHHTISRLFDRI